MCAWAGSISKTRIVKKRVCRKCNTKIRVNSSRFNHFAFRVEGGGYRFLGLSPGFGESTGERSLHLSRLYHNMTGLYYAGG